MRTDSGDLFEAAERRHRERRRRTAWIYDTLDRVFFPVLLLGAILVMAKIVLMILPYFFS